MNNVAQHSNYSFFITLVQSTSLSLEAFGKGMLVNWKYTLPVNGSGYVELNLHEQRDIAFHIKPYYGSDVSTSCMCTKIATHTINFIVLRSILFWTPVLMTFGKDKNAPLTFHSFVGQQTMSLCMQVPMGSISMPIKGPSTMSTTTELVSQRYHHSPTKVDTKFQLEK